MKKIGTLIAATALTACTVNNKEAIETPSIGLANPASVYCQQLGGKLDMVESDAGTTGYCTLPSGERVEEWALYRRAHK